ncbi:DszA family xenobiotic compound monooxygenase-3 [Coleophoma crateriformis]|uniref:DszA family xenobiotic compound monooxygenase-3 n=1 Tax=Coleophoma crateriformis TaxID=565419 RepID=A0A3D8QBX2_9HELO|nr:DszA family xenobiotic compound monooxygenase-3 [Coleophoma crateriformis]
MTAVTKHLAFGITGSTSFEKPFILAKRFSTLDHMTRGRVAWNVVTTYQKAAFEAIGLDNPIEHDERYRQAEEYMEVVYKLWESSWADDALSPDPANDSYIDPDKIRTIRHRGKYFTVNTKHIVDPSPQRTPLIFQAGTSTAGSNFAATHAEAIFVASPSPKILRPKIDTIRRLAAEKGRDPRSMKFFAMFTPILGRTDEEAQAKFENLKLYASTIGGLVLFSSWTGIDLSTIPLDQEIKAADSTVANKVHGILDLFRPEGEDKDAPRWTPRLVAERASIGGLGPISIGSPETVADEMERWVREADIDGFNICYITTPGTFEDVVDLLVPELRRRKIYPEVPDEPLTAREKIYGKGQKMLRDDHFGAKYKYAVYKEDSS